MVPVASAILGRHDAHATHTPACHPQSYHNFMHQHLFAHVDIPAEAVHIPDGMVPLADVPRCALSVLRRAQLQGLLAC